LTIIALVCACAEDEAAPKPSNEATKGAQTEGSSRDASQIEGDAAALRDAEELQPQCARPLAAGELQNRASGPSVFGMAVSAALGSFDATGDSACGIEGVRVCLFETETCTYTDEAGQFVLSDLPDETDIEISFEKDDFARSLRLAHLQGAPIDLRRLRMLRLSERATLFESIDQRVDDERGAVVAVPLAPGEAIGSVTIPADVKISLMPGDARPYYSRGMIEPGGPASDELDPELEATREGGWGFFANVEPGDYTVRIEREGVACSTFFPGFGFGVDELGHVRIRVRAGFGTASIAALCP
jgi:hypothetical protein